MKGLFISYKGDCMKRHSFFAVSLFLFLACMFLLCSCIDASKNFEAGDYEGALEALAWKGGLSTDDYLLKADSLFVLDRKDEALKYYMLFLLLSDPSVNQYQRAVVRFAQLNTHDSLSVLVLDASYGLEARKALYSAYSGLGDVGKACGMIDILSNEMAYPQLVSFVLDRPVAGSYIAQLFSTWQSAIGDGEKTVFLDLLCRYSEMDGVDDEAARTCLEVADSMMDDPFYGQESEILSKVLKTKGNILEKLYDRINARMYWNQAYKLNPNDTSLLEKLGR